MYLIQQTFRNVPNKPWITIADDHTGGCQLTEEAAKAKVEELEKRYPSMTFRYIAA